MMLYVLQSSFLAIVMVAFVFNLEHVTLVSSWVSPIMLE